MRVQSNIPSTVMADEERAKAMRDQEPLKACGYLIAIRQMKQSIRTEEMVISAFQNLASRALAREDDLQAKINTDKCECHVRKLEHHAAILVILLEQSFERYGDLGNFTPKDRTIMTEAVPECVRILEEAEAGINQSASEEARRRSSVSAKTSGDRVFSPARDTDSVFSDDGEDRKPGVWTGKRERSVSPSSKHDDPQSTGHRHKRLAVAGAEQSVYEGLHRQGSIAVVPCRGLSADLQPQSAPDNLVQSLPLRLRTATPTIHLETESNGQHESIAADGNARSAERMVSCPQVVIQADRLASIAAPRSNATVNLRARALASIPSETFVTHSRAGASPNNGNVPEHLLKAGVKPIPSWLSAKMSMKQRNATLASRLGKLILLIKECREATEKQNNDRLTTAFDKLRDELHAVMFFDIPNKDIVFPIALRITGLLGQQWGLPTIFAQALAGGVQYTHDIRADAQELYNKLMSRQFEIDLCRGLKRVTNKKQTYFVVDPAYPRKVPCDTFGDNGLVNGQWWPMQLCAFRDGAHGSVWGGIYGVPGKGACSIVLSSGGYDDEDYGDVIWYCGTNTKKDEEATANTNRLLESFNGFMERGVKKLNPVRVIRSHKIRDDKSPVRPAVGLCYDGLYEVKLFKAIKEGVQNFKFRLERIAGQPPIRGDRPFKEEIEAYERDRECWKQERGTVASFGH